MLRPTVDATAPPIEQTGTLPVGQTLDEYIRDQERRYGYGPFALDLLPIFDNLDRTLAAAKKASDTGPLVQGVAMVQGQFLEMLKRHGIIKIEADGKTFDPTKTHNAPGKYGKVVFAERVVVPNAVNIDFSGFAALIDRIVAVLDHHMGLKAASLGVAV